MKYKIVKIYLGVCKSHNEAIEQLTNYVNSDIERGWIPHGSIVKFDSYLLQSMIKHEDK